MEKNIYILLFIIFGWMSLSSQVYAFGCYNSGGTGYWFDSGQSGDIVINIPAITLSKTTLSFELVNMADFAYCNGAPDPQWKDALRGTQLALSSGLSNLGFEGYLKSGNAESIPTAAAQICIWADNTCSITNGAYIGNRPINAQIIIKRSNGSGNWATGTILNAGTEVARLVTEARFLGTNSWRPAVTWIFKLSADMTIPATTCNIVTPYDQTIVNLPSVSRTDLVGNGTGRYANANKEFKFNLSCDAGTKVSVKVEGDTMTGQDTVLENKISGNPDVGIQLLYNNTTVVKPYETLKLVDSASAGQQLFSFNAYYFTQSTSVTGGQVKASATFWFDYQ